MGAATLSNVIIEQQLTVGLLDKLFRIWNCYYTTDIFRIARSRALLSLYFVANLCDSMLCCRDAYQKLDKLNRNGKTVCRHVRERIEKWIERKGIEREVSKH